MSRGAATHRMNVANLSFGSTAAVVTSVGLVVGLDAATATKPAIVGGLLIVALADNLTDALSMHVYEESHRRLPPRDTLFATTSNFLARLVLALTFVGIVVALPMRIAAMASAVWGLALLAALTWALARERRVSAPGEIAKHVVAAVLVVLASRIIGMAIGAGMG